VAWSGKREILIGVASVFRVTPENTCTGPYLYTSTQCNGVFLDCIINTDSTHIPDDIDISNNTDISNITDITNNT
jgi:hypothetical protein